VLAQQQCEELQHTARTLCGLFEGLTNWTKEVCRAEASKAIPARGVMTVKTERTLSTAQSRRRQRRYRTLEEVVCRTNLPNCRPLTACAVLSRIGNGLPAQSGWQSLNDARFGFRRSCSHRRRFATGGSCRRHPGAIDESRARGRSSHCNRAAQWLLAGRNSSGGMLVGTSTAGEAITENTCSIEKGAP